MPKVSIVVAAYNLENYIEKCLNSIINQSFLDLEVIVVDDGSTDNTLKIVQQKARKDHRIVPLHKKNEGISEARKSGFELVKGEYVLFVDGDDWIHEKTIEILYDRAQTRDYDMICYKHIMVKDYQDIVKEGSDSIRTLDGHELLEQFMKGIMPHEIWSKFIKRSFILENKIVFPSHISYSEDLALTCSLAIHKPKVCIIDRYLYYYFQRSTSLMHVVSYKILEIVKTINFVKEQLIENDLLDKYREEFEYLAFSQIYYEHRRIIHGMDNEISKTLYKTWKEMNLHIYNNIYYRQLLEKDKFKSKLVSRLCESNYTIGRIYYKAQRSFHKSKINAI